MARRLFQVELPVHREWEAIEPLRQTVTGCLRLVFRDHALCDALAMVAGELLENAVKFGARRAPGAEGLTVSVIGADEEVTIEVTNPVEPDDTEISRLAAELDRIRRAPSPREAYLDAMRRVAVAGAGTGLGLSRIAYEGGCDLAAEVGPGWMLTVRATTRHLRPVAPTAAPPA